jgi:hypothetical protein
MHYEASTVYDNLNNVNKMTFKMIERKLLFFFLHLMAFLKLNEHKSQYDATKREK